MSMSTIIAVGSGGFLGAITRMAMTGWVNKTFPHALPLGTLGVNVAGSFLMGILFGLFYVSGFFSPTMKSFLTTGFLGAMTTYSTFAMESFFLMQGGSFWFATLNVLLNVTATILFAGAGYLAVLKLGA